MNNFDEYLHKRVAEDPITVPKEVGKHIDEILASLPEKTETNIDGVEDAKVLAFPQKRRYTRYLSAAACITFVIFFAMPNISSTYASAASKIPVLGEVVKVLTIHTYTYDDGNHEMSVLVPEVDEEADSAKQLNAEMAVFTDQIVTEFYDDIGIYGSDSHESISVDHHVMTNTNRWFTMKLTVTKTAASSDTYYQYYHIDKQAGDIVSLGMLFSDDSYIDSLTNEIKQQIKEQMKKDDSLAYFTDNPALGDDFITLHDEHNFYINDDGKLVIPFDKYEIAPGYMGCPEFEIPTKVIKKLLNNEYKGLFS